MPLKIQYLADMLRTGSSLLRGCKMCLESGSVQSDVKSGLDGLVLMGNSTSIHFMISMLNLLIKLLDKYQHDRGTAMYSTSTQLSVSDVHAMLWTKHVVLDRS